MLEFVLDHLKICNKAVCEPPIVIRICPHGPKYPRNMQRGSEKNPQGYITLKNYSHVLDPEF